MYTPPFQITSRIIELISMISEKIGEVTHLNNNSNKVKLRKDNHIKTIHSSLAIENNSLTIEQITDIINGKSVLGNAAEILEVKNAIKVYELLLYLNPYDEKDLLKAHSIMMQGLVTDSGKYRTGGVGVFNGDNVVHMPPPAQRVALLMGELFAWLKDSDVHPLVKSCVFHYEFEFIHPFQDGNGRIGRLWQTVILKDWKEIFAWLPVETLIKEHQSDYYNALNICDKNGNSTVFIEFMLRLILETITPLTKTDKKVTAKVTVKVTANQKKIIEAVIDNPYVTIDELAVIVGIARKNIVTNMKKLQQNALIKRVGADKNGYWRVL